MPVTFCSVAAPDPLPLAFCAAIIFCALRCAVPWWIAVWFPVEVVPFAGIIFRVPDFTTTGALLPVVLRAYPKSIWITMNGNL